MKKILICLSVFALATTACKKEEEKGDLAPTYPQSFTFQSASNPSSIHVYTKSAEINAPGHASATDSEIANFTGYLNDENATYSGDKLIIINDHQIIAKDNTGSDTIPYVTSGDYLVLGGGLIYIKKSGDALTINSYFQVNKTSDGSFRVTDNGTIDKDETLMSTVQKYMAAGDTIAARSYDLVYKK